MARVGDLIGKDNTVYQGMVEGINNKMNIDMEECFANPFYKEAIVAEIIVHNLGKGAYVDLTEVQTHFEQEHWHKILRKYANKYGIKCGLEMLKGLSRADQKLPFGKQSAFMGSPLLAMSKPLV